MVAKITIPKTIRKALHYNENKCRHGAAECIYAHAFLKDAAALSFQQKLHRFEQLNALNQRAGTNTIHISLNFAPGENFSRDLLQQVAATYMDKIGFGSQPFLVYQHTDAGHPHIHIISTNIQQDGRRISLHNIGKLKSSAARREIETIFNLERAGESKQYQQEELSQQVKAITYGHQPTRQAITNVLLTILPRYQFSSLQQLNALLGQYHIRADRGNENSVVYKHNGLLYRILDDKGNPVGVPLKASSIYFKPTLAFLEKRFVQGDLAKKQCKKSVAARVEWVLRSSPRTLQSFEQSLKKEKILLISRINEQGIIYGLTYIDHQTKTVFNGSELGKQYSAHAIMASFNPTNPGINKTAAVEYGPSQQKKMDTAFTNFAKEMSVEVNTSLLQVLTTTAPQAVPVPYQLKKKKRKKNRFLP